MKSISRILNILSIVFGFSLIAISQNVSYDETPIVLTTATGEIHGTLTIPKNSKKVPVALLIAGSGPTDRNGNNKFAKNDGLKLLAHELADKKIASLRYDKRGLAESEGAMTSESDLRFEDFVNDAKAWVDLLKADKRFKSVTIIGHSEGSLIGMLASENAQGYVSLAGPGRYANELLKDQLNTIPESMKKATFASIDSLKQGYTLKTVDPRLYSIFRPSVQPYLISWFKYDPAQEIAKLKIPVLIIQGSTDLQVGVEEGKKLAAANPKAKYVVIENMNHVFRKVGDDRQTNLATYTNSSMPLHEELVKTLVTFIKKI